MSCFFSLMKNWMNINKLKLKYNRRKRRDSRQALVTVKVEEVVLHHGRRDTFPNLRSLVTSCIVSEFVSEILKSGEVCSRMCLMF